MSFSDQIHSCLISCVKPAAIAILLAAQSAFAADDTLPVLQVTPKGPQIAARPEVLGHNIPANDWHGMVGSAEPFLMDPKTREPIASWVPLTHAFALRSVRYHCGNKYPWKDTVGPLTDRKRVEHEQWKAMYRTEVGLDEFLRWAESLPQSPEVTLIASPLRPVDEVADLVAYCNAEKGPMAEMRAANGHPKPYQVKIWELGNEVDWNGRGDLDIMRADTPLEKRKSLSVDEYIEQCKLRITEMRKIDPSIKIYAQAKTSPWSINNPKWTEWHQVVLREMGSMIDGITIHPYYDGYPVPIALQSVDKLIADIHQYGPKDRKLAVWVSEHSRWVNYQNAQERPQSWGLQGAISAGDFVLAMMERPEISIANYWCYAHRGPWRVLNANWENGGDQKFGTGAYWLYLLMNRAYGPKFQALKVSQPKGDLVPGGYPYTVSAAVFRDPQTHRTAVVAVNRAEKQAFNLALDQALISSTKVTRLVVTGESLKATNISETPSAVKMTEDENWGRRVDGRQMLLSLPARSVTAWIWE